MRELSPAAAAAPEPKASLATLAVLGLPAMVLAALTAWFCAGCWQDIRGTMAARQVALQRQDAAPADLARQQRLIDAWDAEHLSYRQANPDIATAQFAQDLRDSVTRAGGTPRSLTPKPIQEHVSPPRLQVEINFALSANALAGWLRQMEDARPGVLIDALDVEAFSGDSGPHQLTVHVAASALWQPIPH